MPATEVPWLGERLRAERVRRGISVRGLARSVGVSASMISQIETARSRPSVRTLYAITEALGVSVEDLFTAPGAPADGSPPDGAPARGAPGTVLQALGAMRGARLGPLVRPDARRTLTLDGGVTWELLGDLPGRAVDFLRITYPPGGSSSTGGGLMRHPGSEYGLVLRGELVLTLGFEELRLRPGDAVSFESTTPHSYRNDGAEPAVGIWFVVEHGR